MCGLVGYWEPSELDSERATRTVGAMTAELAHRGPDDSGLLLESKSGLALGHRRLSILDLSAAGHQPMVSSSGRSVIVYNGEIYNFSALRRELVAQGQRFRSHTDTEVIINACEQWGVEATLERLNGMFAFALWDRRSRSLTLARDRLGIKPLYFGRVDRTFFFASELRALRAHPSFNPEVDRDSLALFFRHNYIPAPHTIFRNVFKLLPGHWLTLESPGGEPDPKPYWSLSEVILSGDHEPAASDEAEVEEQLTLLLQDAVAGQMVSDVPLGAFLSGGIDSSLVVSLMQSQFGKAVRTFSIGFHEDEYNEATYAKAVAEHLGTDHTELYVTPSQARDVIPELPAIFDEPFSDSSQIPTHLVSRLAREDVTVVLSGDGGDELFGGYDRYRRISRIWGRIGWMPKPVRQLGGRAMHAVPDPAWTGIGALLGRKGRRSSNGTFGEQISKLADVLEAGTAQGAYRYLVSHWKRPTELVPGSIEPPTTLGNPRSASWLADFVRQMMYLDLVTYLPDDILTKVDRASMAVGLEARVPLLDHRVVEFAGTLPSDFIYRNGRSKWIARSVLGRFVPPHMIDRPKKGFAVPIGRWLRGALRGWAEGLLAEDRLLQEGFLNPKPVRRIWREHVSAKRNWANQLWDVLMFQAWAEFQRSARTDYPEIHRGIAIRQL